MHHITLIALPKPGAPEDAMGVPKDGAMRPGGSSTKPFYMIGNERVALNYPNAGVYLSKYANILLGVQLQNQESTAKDVFIDLDYDYLPGQPTGYTDIIPGK